MTAEQSPTTPAHPGAHHTVLDVWTDIACPWCYIGATRLHRALADYDRADQVTVHWRAYELDPHTPAGAGRTELQALAEAKNMPEDRVRQMFDQVSAVGAEDGLTLDFDRTVSANTFDAHRLVQLAGPDTARGTAVLTALFHARFTRGLAVDDPEVLVGIGAEAGMGEEAVRALLAAPADGPEGAAVTSDEALAGRIGVRGVPFFVADRRLAVSGAQPAETLTRLLDTALDSPADQ